MALLRNSRPAGLILAPGKGLEQTLWQATLRHKEQADDQEQPALTLLKAPDPPDSERL